MPALVKTRTTAQLSSEVDHRRVSRGEVPETEGRILLENHDEFDRKRSEHTQGCLPVLEPEAGGIDVGTAGG